MGQSVRCFPDRRCLASPISTSRRTGSFIRDANFIHWTVNERLIGQCPRAHAVTFAFPRLRNLNRWVHT